jgi:Trk-type K+ transport system membrane component
MVLIIYLRKRKKKDITQRFLLLIPLVIFVVITLVFLLTENYQWVLDQTTVNRIFTVIFIIFTFFYPIIISSNE